MMPILILAAGASSRMRGADKLLLDVGGVPLLRRQINAALSVSRDVRVALPPAPHDRYGCVPDAAQVVAVPDAPQGMSASLRRLIATLSPGTPHAMILLADLPEITSDDLTRVMDAVQTCPDATVWRGATDDGKPGHPLVIAASMFPDFATLSGDTGGQQVLARHLDNTCLVPLPGNRARLDLDTPEDWAAWRAASSAGG